MVYDKKYEGPSLSFCYTKFSIFHGISLSCKILVVRSKLSQVKHITWVTSLSIHSFRSPQDHAIWSWHSNSTLTYTCLFSLIPHCYLMNLSGNIDGNNIKKNLGCCRNTSKHDQEQHSRLCSHHKGLGKINWNKCGNSWEHCLWTWTCYQARQYKGAKWVFDGWFYYSHLGSFVHIPGLLLLASILLNYEVPERQKPGFSI